MEEVRMALRNTRNTSCKAAGVDQVGPELLKADMEEKTNRLHKLFNKLWETVRDLARFVETGTDHYYVLWKCLLYECVLWIYLLYECVL